jgi:hypothetical protein
MTSSLIGFSEISSSYEDCKKFSDLAEPDPKWKAKINSKRAGSARYLELRLGFDGCKP